jgi:hypothetical protein
MINSFKGKPNTIESPLRVMADIDYDDDDKPLADRHWEWERRLDEFLPMSQRAWRQAVHGPKWVNVHQESAANFDLCQLTTGLDGYRIPQFTLDIERVYGGRARFHPVLKIRIQAVQDIFDWLLVRAVVTGQLSRFSHCVVCDCWELKNVGGRRSAKVYNTFKQHQPRNSKKKADPSKVPDCCWSFPMWPGICSRNACRSKFNSVFPDKERKRPRSKFHRQQFIGLRA